MPVVYLHCNYSQAERHKTNKMHKYFQGFNQSTNDAKLLNFINLKKGVNATKLIRFNEKTIKTDVGSFKFEWVNGFIKLL